MCDAENKKSRGKQRNPWQSRVWGDEKRNIKETLGWGVWENVCVTAAEE